jgi:hypothetical protein
MLDETIATLAMAGGTAVVQAAGTDAWAGLRKRVARLLSHGEAQREHAELERLDQTATALEVAGATEVEGVRIRQEASWQARFELLLESLSEAERAGVVAELRALSNGPAQAATYTVDASHAQGVQTGSGNTQHNEFR